MIPNEEEYERAARDVARELFQDDDCDIDGDARVSVGEAVGIVGGWSGAWVACWRWVPGDEIEAHRKAVANDLAGV